MLEPAAIGASGTEVPETVAQFAAPSGANGPGRGTGGTGPACAAPHSGRRQAPRAAGPPGPPAAAGRVDHLGDPAPPRRPGSRSGGRPTAHPTAVRAPGPQRLVADGLQGRLDPYSHVRPHEGLALAVPASRYHVSPRPYPAQLPPCARAPTTACAGSGRAAGCRSRRATSGCPRRCGGSRSPFGRRPPTAAGPSDY